MRRCVFLVVLLCLLTLLQGSSAEKTPAPTTKTTPTSSGNSTGGTLAPTTKTTPTSPGISTGGTLAPTTKTTPTSPGSSAEKTPAPTTKTTPTSPGNSTGGTLAPTTKTTPTSPGISTGGTLAPTTKTTPTSPGNSTGGTLAPTMKTTPTSPGNSTGGTLAPTMKTTPTSPGISTGGTLAPTTKTTPTSPGNSTGGTPAPTTKTTPTSPGMNTTSSSAAMPANLCNPDPCGTNLAECIALHSIFTCQCRYGFYYSNKDCHKGKIFPGVITLKEFYSVQTVNSVQYEEVFRNITTFFKDAFNNSNLTGFGQTVIVEIQSLKDSRASLPVKVTVTNLFMENSTVSNETVTSAINNATENSSYVSQYRATTYCAAFNCDDKTTRCEENMFPKCICKGGFSKTEWDDRSCSDCSADCSAEENKYCVNERGIPTCKCMPNFESNNGKCVSCPVGYSGENCKNNSELILIIVGTVFGAIILSLVIAVSIVSARAKHKQHPEKKSLIKSRYSNSDMPDDRQTTIFPRVQTTSGHANPGYQPNNPYEMHSSNRGHFLERDYDDLYKISQEPERFRMQSRY